VRKLAYDELRTLVALPDAGARQALRKDLQSEGLLYCREVAALPALRDKLKQSDADLLIISLEEGQWDAAALIREVRLSAVGTNPFMVIIVLLEEPTPRTVSAVVNAGADDLLLSPWLGRLLVARLDGFARGRKPFMVTHDYIGPERRGLLREDEDAPQSIDVPNPVQWLNAGNADREAFRLKIEGALLQVNRLRIKSSGGQLRFLAELAVERFSAGGHVAILPTVRSLLEASDDMVRRAANTDYAPAIELTSGLRVLCQRLLREKREPRQDEIAVLPSLAGAVLDAIHLHEAEAPPAA